MNVAKKIQKAVCLAALSVAALYTGVLSANTTTVPDTTALNTTTVLNCNASCAGAQVGCCGSSTGKCQYRPTTGESWRHGEIQNGNCVINGIVVGKMPPEKAEPIKDKEISP